MIPIISFIGSSGSGKTSLLEKVVKELKKRGLKVAVIKHSHHDDLGFDKQGKDSYRYTQAGADVVVLSGTQEMAIMKKTGHDLSPQEISRLLDIDIDVILTEGFKNASTMKIEVHRRDIESGLLSNPKQLLAVVTDEPLNGITAPQFEFGKDNTLEIADLIEKWLDSQSREQIELYVNGEFVPMKPFVQDIIARAMEGMASSLKGVGEIKNIRFSMRRRR